MQLPSINDIALTLGGNVVNSEALVPGPGHSAEDRSLSIKLDGKARDGFIVHSFADDDPGVCRDYVRRKLGLPEFKPRKTKTSGGARPFSPTVAKYVYRLADSTPYLQVHRLADKSGFPQYHWDGEKWIAGKPGGPKVPYMLPQLIAAAAATPIYIVEGEKDCDNLAKVGFVATCNSEGADGGSGKKWTSDLNQHFKDRHVYIIPDNDAQGHKHAEHVARNLKPIAKSVRIVELPSLPPKGDVSNWLESDSAGVKLAKLAAAAPLWEPTPASEPPEAEAEDEAKPVSALLPSPNMPMAVARLFVAERCLDDGVLTLHHWRGGWWQWRRSHWAEVEDREVRSLLYAFTENARYRDAEGNMMPWAPTRKKIGDLLEALAAITILVADIDQPTWLDGRSTGIIVAVANGLLEVETRHLLPHSPQFFNQTAVPFDYDKNAPEPKRWYGFLDALWPGEPTAIDMLGEWFGYVISGRLDLHKIFVMVGPTRGGKGVIARILTALIGKQNVAGPTLSSLGTEFGLAPLLGKSLAIISDARSGGGKNSPAVVGACFRSRARIR